MELFGIFDQEPADLRRHRTIGVSKQQSSVSEWVYAICLLYTVTNVVGTTKVYALMC